MDLSETNVVYLVVFDGGIDRYAIQATAAYTPDDGWESDVDVTTVGNFSKVIQRFAVADTVVPLNMRDSVPSWGAREPVDPPPFASD